VTSIASDVWRARDAITEAIVSRGGAADSVSDMRAP
jgi:hypothetical protein